MFMRNGTLYDGLRFFDDSKNMINNVEWADDYKESRWTPMQDIPIGQHIVGFKCNIEGDSLHYLTLLLGIKGKAEITNKLYFPALEMYPSFEEFEQLYKQGSFALRLINFKNRDEGSLSGLQFVFDNGEESPFIEAHGFLRQYTRSV